MSLKKLTELCKASIDVRINEHKSIYSTVASEILDLEKDDREEIDTNVVRLNELQGVINNLLVKKKKRKRKI